MAFYEIRQDILKQDHPNLHFRAFNDHNADLLLWMVKDTFDVDAFQLSFRHLEYVGEPEVIVEWRQSASLKFGEVEHGLHLKKMTGIIHFKPFIPQIALQKMIHEFDQRSGDIDSRICEFVLQALNESLTVLTPEISNNS